MQGWFRAVDSQNVMGRVVEVDKVHAAQSREARREITFKQPVMESKVAGSSDISHQQIKEWNKKEICGRFPGAWEAYEASKATSRPIQDFNPAPDGMPIDKAEFIPASKREWLKMTGFSTVDQLADMTDHQIQDLGPGARAWKKKARELLGKGK
jgi:uncharacterized protein YjiS (DUF1127 family)